MRYMLVIPSLLCLCLFAQDAPKKEAPKKMNPFENMKNLKIFKTQTGDQVRETMFSFRTALGVNCFYCHVQGDFASDDNPKKEVARNMILMSREINGHFPADGNMRVRCYTCHRGAVKPLTAPPPADPAKPAEPPK